VDYEILNKARKLGVIGSILSVVIAIFIHEGITQFVRFIWPSTSERWALLPYDIRSIGDAGSIHLLVGILVALALFVSILGYSNKISKAFSAIAAIASLVSVVLMAQWLIPYTDVWLTVENEIPITPPHVLNLETLMVQSFTVIFLSLLLAGLAGIIERGPDKVANAGYVLTLIGGLGAIIYTFATGGFFVSTYGDAIFVVTGYVIAFIGYIGLGVVFYRPVPRSESHPDSQEQETDPQP
jgi:hypothetical protein